jgi:phosphatidylethanolamine/phosphatidyl-N-methylethanolamine N-methyltransferase
MPVTSRLGWRTEFPWARYEHWAQGAPVRLLERRPLPPLGHFWLLRYARLDDGETDFIAATASETAMTANRFQARA